MHTRSLAKWAGFLPFLLLLILARDAFADKLLGPGWHNIVPAGLPASADPGLAPPPVPGNLPGPKAPRRDNPAGGPAATAITPELQALATALKNNPVKIFNYVHNKIEYQPYYGSHKGAHTTYLDGAGNDMDQASLLIALLNQAGYAATSYVYGTYTMRNTSADGRDLANWLGATPSLAPSVIATGGIPIYTGTNYGSYVVWPFDHVWVRATLNGTPYDLDPSYKQYQVFNGIDFKAASGYDRSQLLTAAAGTSTADYTQNLNRAEVESRFGQYAANLRNYIKANAPAAEIEQILGGRRILDQPITELSQGAPPPVFSPTVATTFDSIPAQYAATFRVEVGDEIDETFNVDSLQGNRLSLAFASNNAQLWLGDTVAAQESGGSGTTTSVTLTANHPSGGFSQGIPSVTYQRSGSYDLTYSFYPNPRSSGQVDASARRLQTYLAAGLTDTSRQVMTETLHSLGLKWVRRVNLGQAMVGKVLGSFCEVHHIIGRSGQEDGYYVDMPGVFVSTIDDTGTDFKAFNAGSLLSSAMEHGVIEQTGGSAALSTVKCLVLANDGGQKIFRATAVNYSSTVNPQLTNYSAGQKSSFSSSVNSGFTLLLHQNGKTGLNQWQGFGYAGIANSSAQMIIGGGYSGGYNSFPGPISGSDANQLSILGSDGVWHPANVDPTLSNEPVDLLTGAYTMVHTDLTLGQPGSPSGLSFTRYYDSSRNFVTSAMGNGWRHSCEGRVTLSSELDMAFGRAQPADAAQTIVGIMSVVDFADTSTTAKELMVGTLAANWTVDSILNNAANVQLGDRRLTYVSHPDGLWNPPPGATTALTGASGSFTLQPRFGGSIIFDARNRVSQWQDVDNNTQTYAYDAAERLATVTDAHGRTLTLSYADGTSQLVQAVADSSGRSVVFTYSGNNLTGIRDVENFQTTLVYDSRNRLTDWKDHALQSVTHNDYDDLDRVYQQLSQNLGSHLWQFRYSPGMTVEVDPMGAETAYLFDYKNRPSGTIDALGHSSSISYDSQNHVTQTTDATGRNTTFLYDGNQNLTKSTDNNNKDTAYQYDGSLRLWKVTDATGRTTQYGYDAQNHLSSVTDPGSRQTRYFYQAGGLLDHIIDSAGNTTSLTAYDSFGNPTAVTRPDGTTTTASYNARGDLLSYTDGRQKTTTYSYDKRRLIKTRTDALNKTTQWSYDSNGYLASTTDRNNHTLATTYDNLGHLKTTQSPDTGAITSAYDLRDLLTSVTDALGHQATLGYDAAGRRTSLTNALSVAAGQWTYDDAGRVSTQSDGLNHATQFFYDTTGRLDYTLDPLLHRIDHTYDDAGRPLTLRNRRGLTFGFGYAADGLPNTFSYPSARQSGVLDREARGLPKSVKSPGGQQTALTYDARARLKTRADGVGSIAWTYDNEGNATDVVQTIGGTNATIHRVFDELGRITNCTDAQGYSIGYTYDNEGNVASITYPGNKTVSYTYDGFNRIKTVTDWAGRGTTYSYDIAGRLQTVVRPNATRQRVSFDDANRLTASFEEKMSGSSVVGTLWQAGYAYDNASRLTSFNPTPMARTFAPDATAMTYDGDNQLVSYNGQAVGHDLDGNLLAAPVQGTLLGTLTWDKRNRLTSAGGVGYAYDAENRRMSSTVGGQTTRYVYSRGAALDRLLAKVNPDGSVTRYIYGAGLLYEETTSAGGVAQSPVYYHFDWRGDTVALSDASGNVTARISYSPYGEETIESGAAQVASTPFRFNGQWGVMTEPTGLLSMQARYYSPVLRRFLNEDPSGFAGGVNLYAYASGDPVDFLDPFGLGPVTSDNSGWTRFFGGLRALGGGVEATAGITLGIATSWTGIGAVGGGLVAVHGADQLQAGLRQLFTGQSADSFTSSGLQAAGLSQGWANGVDAAISVVGTAGASWATASIRSAEIAAANTAPELGRKLEYFLGNATGNAHNIERSTGMLRQLQSVGLHDNPATRQYLTEHLGSVVNNASNIVRTQANGTVVRESLLMGPNGGMKFETVWDGAKLITGKLLGGN